MNHNVNTLFAGYLIWASCGRVIWPQGHQDPEAENHYSSVFIIAMFLGMGMYPSFISVCLALDCRNANFLYTDFVTWHFAESVDQCLKLSSGVFNISYTWNHTLWIIRIIFNPSLTICICLSHYCVVKIQHNKVNSNERKHLAGACLVLQRVTMLLSWQEVWWQAWD